MKKNLILPSEIPWPEIKGADLEELLYWLFDSMGAKELEWRIGGRGSGTSDQGRDLELKFFTPSPDGTLTKQTWWVEAKGRSKTVEPTEVHQAVHNVAGKKYIEVLVIATNSNFSNPTRDWVKEWQKDNPRPIIKLWERTELENLCSKNPLAIIRLHSEAISPQGKVEIVKTKLWDYASFSDEPILKSIWKERSSLEIDERALFALISSEFANGNIGFRSWGVEVSNELLVSTLCSGLINSLYFVFRANDNGVRQEPIIRAISYLVLISLQSNGVPYTSSLLRNVWHSIDDREFPEKVIEFILDPILGTLQTEMKDVCTNNCSRVMTDPEMLPIIEIERYWDRLDPNTNEEAAEKRILGLEAFDKPCQIGFKVNKEIGCPLCAIEAPYSSLEELLEVVSKVSNFRSAQAKSA